MGLFDKEDIKLLAAKLQVQVELLEKENKRLTKQVDRLQEALFAKESPVAYSNMKADEADVEQSVSKENMIRMKEESDFWTNYASLQEGPLFESIEDVKSALLQKIGTPEVASLHDNDES